ncbi:MAG: hypothetical protein JWR16_2253 [Nevskia sp.]|nr:hypothetical protein [Nevskia sp.]
MNKTQQNSPLGMAVARALALSLPSSEEHDHFGSPSFRVKGKIFATLSAQAAHSVLKLSLADQAALTATDPATFSSVPHWGRFGWTQVELADMDADFFRQLLSTAWRQVAPKKLVVAYDQDA